MLLYAEIFVYEMAEELTAKRIGLPQIIYKVFVFEAIGVDNNSFFLLHSSDCMELYTLICNMIGVEQTN